MTRVVALEKKNGENCTNIPHAVNKVCRILSQKYWVHYHDDRKEIITSTGAQREVWLEHQDVERKAFPYKFYLKNEAFTLRVIWPVSDGQDVGIVLLFDVEKKKLENHCP